MPTSPRSRRNSKNCAPSLTSALKKVSAPSVHPCRRTCRAVQCHHEPENTTCTTPGCGCQLKRIGQDVSEKLDYTPGVFTVERHIRGKWTCANCRTLTQAPVAAEIIDWGLRPPGYWRRCWWPSTPITCRCTARKPSSARAGLTIPRSTLAAWIGQCGVRLQRLVDALKEQLLHCAVVHADETPVAMLAPGNGKIPPPPRSSSSGSCTASSAKSDSCRPMPSPYLTGIEMILSPSAEGLSSPTGGSAAPPLPTLTGIEATLVIPSCVVNTCR